MVPAMDSDPSCPFPVGAGAAETILIEASAETLAAHPADRVDRWLARCLDARGNAAPLSRNRLKSLILDGRLTADGRSEEHTSELQSLMRISYAVFCLQK